MINKMSNKVLCIFVALSYCFVSIQPQKVEKVSVTVYYESLCHNARKFFTSQLYPTLLTNLGEWVNLTLVPYGKVTETVLDNQIQFACNRGPFECYGNKIHACAINNIAPNSNTEYGFNNVTVGAINCLMDNVKETIVDGEKRYNFSIEYCSNINHVPDYIRSIENCVGHSQGTDYLAAMGSLTRALRPRLIYVPTITFDGQEKSQDAQNNFIKELCASLKVDEKPAECNSKKSVLQSVPTISYDDQSTSQAIQEDSKKALCAGLIDVEEPVECKNNASTLVISTLTLAIILFKQLF